jgi:penicillin-binding protein 2
MYHLRLKIFIFLCISGLTVAVGRLLILQTRHVETARQELADLRVMPAQQRPTIRGKILDRSGQTLALDRPAFYLRISYDLTRYMDYRWREGRIRRAIRDNVTRQEAEERLARQWHKHMEDLNHAIDLANSLADISEDEILAEINQINDRMWSSAQYIYWRRRNPQGTRSEFNEQRASLTPEKIVTIDLYEMHQKYPLIELKNHQDLLRAQTEIVNVNGLDIQPMTKRDYPFGSSACHLIGWVAPGQEDETELFSDDAYMRYLAGEVLGKSGIEWIYEPVLRGRRGEVRYDRGGNLLERKEPQYGQNVTLTLDIALQQKIEKLLADKSMPHEGKISAAVVLDKNTNDILAMVSVPGYDLNSVRRDYMKLLKDENLNAPLRNRAIQTHYPPGSTAKPLVLIAGLEEGKVGPHEPISCSGYNIPTGGWPRCLLQREYGIGHDNHFGAGGNTPRNALRGSCNIYFSQVAHRLDSARLQYWLWQFGCGQNVFVMNPPAIAGEIPLNRQFSQSCGSLIFGIQRRPADSPADLTALPDYERKWWGIGQGNMRVTVLQVANALAAFTRDGVYKQPRLVIDPADPANERGQRRIRLSSSTIAVVRDGLKAVIYESHGTAQKQFKDSELFGRNMTVYGKTGSTENPYVAWFECFAEDNRGRGIIAVVMIEEGQRGAGEAAPLGHEILRYCNEAGYIGTRPPAENPS